MNQTPENYLAFGALDDAAKAYLVLKPKNDAAQLELTALMLPAHFTLQHAENAADDFNAGRTWSFRANPDQILRGEQIPQLHRAPGA